jgi:DNA-binding NarL/FixJ family response regulator
MLHVGLAIAGDLLLDAIERDLRTQQHILTVLRRESDLLQKACRGEFDVLILDERFSTHTGELLPTLRNSGVGIVLIGDSSSSAYISRQIHAGVDVYLYRHDALRPLLDTALTFAFSKRLFLSPSAASAYSYPPDCLDADCQAVLRLLAQDKRISVIADELQIGRSRAYYLLGRLKDTLGATTIAGTLMQAARLGYV